MPPVLSSSHPLPLLRHLTSCAFGTARLLISLTTLAISSSASFRASSLTRAISSCFWCISASNLARSVARRVVANVKGRGTVVDTAAVVTTKIAVLGELVSIVVVAVCKEILPALVLVLDEDANEDGTRSSRQCNQASPWSDSSNISFFSPPSPLLLPSSFSPAPLLPPPPPSFKPSPEMHGSVTTRRARASARNVNGTGLVGCTADVAPSLLESAASVVLTPTHGFFSRSFASREEDPVLDGPISFPTTGYTDCDDGCNTTLVPEVLTAVVFPTLDPEALDTTARSLFAIPSRRCASRNWVRWEAPIVLPPPTPDPILAFVECIFEVVTVVLEVLVMEVEEDLGTYFAGRVLVDRVVLTILSLSILECARTSTLGLDVFLSVPIPSPGTHIQISASESSMTTSPYICPSTSPSVFSNAIISSFIEINTPLQFESTFGLPAHLRAGTFESEPASAIVIMMSTTSHSSSSSFSTSSPEASGGFLVGETVKAHRDGLDRCMVTLDQLPGTAEDVPAIKVSEHVPDGDPDPIADVDTSTNVYRSIGKDFGENAVIEAHHFKSGGDWWYGTTVNTGGSRFSLQTCVQLVEPVQVTALYSYEDSSPYKLSFTEGNALTIVDRLESDWWRAEWDGVIYTMLAAYVEVSEAQLSNIFDSERCESQPDGGEGQRTHKLDCVPAIIGVDDGASDVSQGPDLDATETFSNQERHGLERRRVLEVVGVIVSEPTDYSLPTLLRTNGYGGVDGVTALGGPADSSSTSRVGDAFEHHGTYKKMHGGQSLAANRMSASSFDTTSSLAVSSPPRSSATSLSPSLQDRERGGGECRTSHFLSFLGRHTRSSTPDTDRKRKIPIISGPIHVSVSNTAAVSGDPHISMTRESSPTFGTAWEAIFELILTQADYVRDLQLIVELFYSRLVDMLEAESSPVIFFNIEDILLTRTAFLSTLEERQRECRLYMDHVGDLLETHMPHMRVYLDSSVNHANAGKVLQSHRDANPELSTQLQCLREDPSARNLDLFSYLLVPMRRLTRYPLLIRQILQYTDPPTTTPDLSVAPRLTQSLPTEHAERESIANSLACAERILEEVNETIRDREGRERLGEVSEELRIGKDRLDLTLPTHHLGPRRLLKEGVLAKAKSGRKLRVLLCSDILLLLTESEGGGLYRPLPVHELEIHTWRRYARSEDAYIRIHRACPRGGETLVLRAPSIREARAWTEAIVLAAAKAKEGIRVAVSDSQDTKVEFGSTAIGVVMGHVASAGSPHASGDLGNGYSG
ncbi:hypothetical protein EDD15DRAFT_2376903 [Pisolithus albus]|nr:hypothetical protein EDD15DRAFT_2376903 [Pisolithus albus]